jgi:hypothetical protein
VEVRSRVEQLPVQQLSCYWLAVRRAAATTRSSDGRYQPSSGPAG